MERLFCAASPTASMYGCCHGLVLVCRGAEKPGFRGFLWFRRGFCGQTVGMSGFFLNGDGSDSSLGDAGVGDYASKMVGVVLSCSAWTQPMKQRKAL